MSLKGVKSEALLPESGLEADLNKMKIEQVFETQKSAIKTTTLSKDHDQVDMLFKAIKEGDLDMCRFLSSQGADLNFVKSDGYTPLLQATEDNLYNVVEFLVENGADLFLETKHICSPMQMAGRQQYVKIQLYFFSRVMQSGSPKYLLYGMLCPNNKLIYDSFVHIILKPEKQPEHESNKILRDILSQYSSIVDTVMKTNKQTYYNLAFVDVVYASLPEGMNTFVSSILSQYATTEHAANLASLSDVCVENTLSSSHPKDTQKDEEECERPYLKPSTYSYVNVSDDWLEGTPAMDSINLHSKKNNKNKSNGSSNKKKGKK